MEDVITFHVPARGIQNKVLSLKLKVKMMKIFNKFKP